MKKLYFFCFIFLLISGSLFSQGLETFSNLPLSGNNYQQGSFTGDNGVVWNYTACRDENNDANNSGIDGEAIMLRRISSNSAISAQSGANGVGEVTMNLYKGFTGAGNRQVELFVNGTSYGTSTAFDDYTEQTFTVTGINETGDVLIEVKNNTGKQVIVDNVQWTESGQTLSTLNDVVFEFSVFPNPVSNGSVSIKTKHEGPFKVEIYDVLGKLVLAEKMTTTRLNVSQLNAGVYILKINLDGAIATKKLIIK